MTNVRELSGTEVNGWHLGEVLGQGADGIVYVGEKAGQEAAVKILFPEVLAKYGFEGAVERLELQLSLKGEKHHPNLVEVSEGGKAAELDDSLYLAMERVPGTPLNKAVVNIPRDAIPSLIKQLASAARFLEKHTLAHRDIKPANIIVSDDFSHLTLLDLGIILETCTDDDDRLSGEEFVATTRYSPPEFVWRKEESSSVDAWRAITFYQIGATLHDLIMRKPLFQGCDKPHANLYDAVRYRSPVINEPECDPWLIQLAKCCLVKNWRNRIQLVSWESFFGPSEDDTDLSYQRKLIQLRQIRNNEARLAQENNHGKDLKDSRIKDLWHLYDQVFMETRQFLMDVHIFPKFSGTHSRISDNKYALRFEFEKDMQLTFDKLIVVEILMSVGSKHESATELEVTANQSDGETVFHGKWIEMLTVKSASTIVQQSLMQVADAIVP